MCEVVSFPTPVITRLLPCVFVQDLSVLLEKNDSLKEITLEFFSNHFPTSYLVCTVFEVLWGLLSKCSVSA